VKNVADIHTRKDLPEGHEELQKFSWELVLTLQRLTEKHNKLLHKMYGRGSEKLADAAELDALQVEMEDLLNQAGMTEEKLAEIREESSIEVTGHRRRRKHPGRNRIPEDLLEAVYHDIPEDEKGCDDCGEEKVIIGYKSHTVVERIPGHYKATRHVFPIYGCRRCKSGVSRAEPVHLPIAKGLAGPMLLTFVLLSKYLYHLPLYRIQRQIFHESRIWFTRSTLSSWVRQVCEGLVRIQRALLEHYRDSRVKHADETPLRVKCEGRYRQGRMWVGLSGDERTAVFLYNRHRSAKAALALLAGSRPGDFLMVDDCASYHKPIKKLDLVDLRCMAHIRRKFVEARKSGRHGDYVKRMVIKIGQLYRIERLAKRLNASDEKRVELRHKYSAQIMAQIKAMLDEPGFAVLPQTAVGGAVEHFRKNWVQASRFLERGDLPIDNSANERIIRPLAIGRNNWLHAGSEKGADSIAILYSIITTCKINGIDPHEYLADILMRLPLRPLRSDITDLLPIGWYQQRNEGRMPPKTPLYPSKH